MLQALLPADLDQAASLLIEGFPERTPTFWRASLDRLRRHGGNMEADFPLGFLWLRKGEPVGVALTPAALRPDRTGARRRVVNVSSWYVRPDERWRAPLMLKSLVKTPDTVYTDLTPTAAVRSMLPGLGFRPINRGTEIVFLSAAALRFRRGDRVTELAPENDPPLMNGHRALGCIPLVLETAGGPTLIVYRRTRVRKIPAASLVYVESHRRLASGMGALARHLIRHGLFFLRAPAVGDPLGFGGVVLPAAFWFALGGDFDDRTDVIGSELTLFDL